MPQHISTNYSAAIGFINLTPLNSVTKPVRMLTPQIRHKIYTIFKQQMHFLKQDVVTVKFKKLAFLIFS